MEIRDRKTPEGIPTPPGFFDRPADVVAKELLGCHLATVIGGRLTQGRIVETEAYMGPDDPASHSHGGRRTNRNSAMYLRYGTIYVYFIYGVHWCFNVVTGAKDHGAAVLVRAIEPTHGLDTMRSRRNQTSVEMLCAGPARLCQAMGIDGSHNGRRLDLAGISVLEADSPSASIDVSPRVGISRAKDWPLRFTESGSKWLSRK